MKKKMTEDEICSAIEARIVDKLDIQAKCDQADAYYNCEYRGDEEVGYSTFISSQVADLVDADMPSLARVFLGAGRTVEFIPVDDQDTQAEEKTALVDDMLRGVDNYYRTMHGALMGITLHPISVLRYGIEEKENIKIRKHQDISAEQHAALFVKYKNAFDSVETLAMEQDEESGLYDVTFKLANKEDPTPYIRRVAPADFIMSADATDKTDALIIGERLFTRRGDLVKCGYSKAKVDEIPAAARDGLVQEADWASQLVEGFDGYARIDANGDGIAELVRVVKYGSVLLDFEELDDDQRGIGFALGSATIMPDSIVGVSRAERALAYQDAMTSLSRAMLDNTAQIARGRLIVNTSGNIGLNYHDVMGDGSIIRAAPMDGFSLAEAAQPLPVPPVATEAISVIQYLDSQRAQATGSLLANQGLKADSLSKETATRFNGIDTAAQAKVELMARTIAETMIKDLFEGMAYLAQMHGLLPSAWDVDHKARVVVGIGYGDNQKTMESLTGLLQISQQLAGTPMVDAKKVFNLVKRMAMASGIHNIADYFNDPEIPAQTLQSENEQLKRALQQMQQVDPVLQVEQVRAEARMAEAQMKAELEMAKLELERYKAVSANALNLTKLETEAGKQLDAQITQNVQSMSR